MPAPFAGWPARDDQAPEDAAPELQPHAAAQPQRRSTSPAKPEHLTAKPEHLTRSADGHGPGAIPATTKM
jgi:hypothetical protein